MVCAKYDEQNLSHDDNDILRSGHPYFAEEHECHRTGDTRLEPHEFRLCD